MLDWIKWNFQSFLITWCHRTPSLLFSVWVTFGFSYVVCWEGKKRWYHQVSISFFLVLYLCFIAFWNKSCIYSVCYKSLHNQFSNFVLTLHSIILKNMKIKFIFQVKTKPDKHFTLVELKLWFGTTQWNGPWSRR